MKKQIVKLTKQDFELFKRECEKWVDKLGMKSWSIIYSFQDDPEAYGSYVISYTGKSGVIWLSKTWNFEGFTRTQSQITAQLKETALHEVLEILISPLGHLASMRDYNPDEVEHQEHTIIHTLVNVLQK